jgi:uncharacterized protein YndB with AHSA1/START domain
MDLHRMGGIVAALGFAAASPILRSQQPAAAPAQSIVIHQEIDLAGSPQRVYDALTEAKQFASFSGRPATIDAKVGGAFSLFDGHIVGVNVDLVPGKLIVQAWRAADWPAGVYSIARFQLTPQGKGTRVIFDHIGFPEGMKDHLTEGWAANYWSLLAKYFQ